MKFSPSILNSSSISRHVKSLGLLVVVCTMSPAFANVVTVGVYDENLTDENTAVALIQNNGVDVSATSDTGNQVSLATFTSAVQTAFNNNLGGVINFDNGTISGGFGTSSITASYGTSQGNSITIGSAATTSFALQTSLTSRTGISHPGDGQTGNHIGLDASTTGAPDSEDFVFNFSAVNKVVMVGGTILSRSGRPDVSIEAKVTFSDNNTATVTFSSSGNNNGGNDTFAGFKAPDGLFITRLRIDNLNLTGSFRSLDDLGFITSAAVATPIQTWRQTNFGTMANAGNAADNFDADSDGLVNLVEYAFDLNPNQPSVSPVILPPATGYLKIEFPRYADRTDITYNVRSSENLADWTTIASSTGGAPITSSGAHSAAETGDGNQKTVTVEDAALINSTSKRFLRVDIVR